MVQEKLGCDSEWFPRVWRTSQLRKTSSVCSAVLVTVILEAYIRDAPKRSRQADIVTTPQNRLFGFLCCAV